MRRSGRLAATWLAGTADGLSKLEVIRCLERYVAREVYALLAIELATPRA